MAGSYVQKEVVKDFVMNSQRDIELWGFVITIFNHWAENNSWFVILQIYIVSGGLDGFRLKGLKDRSLEGLILH